METPEPRFTVFIRVPRKRGDFVDPPPVSWSSAKERQLWDVLSRTSKGNEIDWNALAEQLNVTPQFVLQQAAWLYERQLSQVKAQMKKVVGRQSGTPSPTPGSLATSTMTGTSSRPLETQIAAARPKSQSKQNSTDSAKRGPSVYSQQPTISMPLRTASGILRSPLHESPVSSAPMSRQSSKDTQTPTYTRSHRGSMQRPLSRSPAQNKLDEEDSTDSGEDLSKSRLSSRRPNPSAAPRRSIITRRDREARRSSLANEQPVDDEDSPPFLPFAGSNESKRRSGSHQDPAATIRGGSSNATIQRPTTHRRATSERIQNSALPQPEVSAPIVNRMTSSTDSGSSDPKPRPINSGPSSARALSQVSNALSPQQQAALAGLSPRRRPGTGKDGSDTSPSMGSSFSDLDDASVTQSALEEALMSNMARGNSNASSNGGGAALGMASRVSGISQALRSRYFDAHSQNTR